jgi:two-component system, sensor histidine kinase LadS
MTHGDQQYMACFVSPAVIFRRFVVLCILTCGCGIGSAWAQAVLPSLFESSRQLNLPEPLQMAVVPVSAYTSAEILPIALPKTLVFQPWKPGMPLPTSAQQDVWLKLVLPATPDQQTWMLRIPRFFLEQATVYQTHPQGSSPWVVQAAGLNLPHPAWPMRSRDPSFMLSTRTDRTQTLFIRLQNSQPITENIELIHAADFAEGANRVGTLYGLILGIFSILTLISVISAITHRSAHFAWFALFTFSMLLSQLTVSGYMTVRVWGSSVFLAKNMGWVMPLLTLAALARLSIVITYAKDLSKFIFYALWCLVISSLLLALGVLVLSTDFPRLLLNIFYACGMVVIFCSIAWIAWRSQHWLWQVTASIVPLMISVMARLAYNLGWVQHVDQALLAGVITASLGLILIYTAMLIQQRDRHALSQREQALETRDGATGLFNERIGAARLPQLILRSNRFERPCGAILIRWLDFDRFMQSGSITMRVKILAHLGNRLNRLARDIDTVARVGDDLFLFLVEAPVQREDLNALASHIISTCMRPAHVMPDNAGYDLHLALWISEGSTADAAYVMELLKTRIDQMRNGNQRRVQYVDTPMSTLPPTEGLLPEEAQKLVQKINSLEATQGLPSIQLPARASPLASMPSPQTPHQ